MPKRLDRELRARVLVGGWTGLSPVINELQLVVWGVGNGPFRDGDEDIVVVVLTGRLEALATETLPQWRRSCVN
jgi:hypothetical protein